MPETCLLIDAGNRRIKWGLYDPARGEPARAQAWLARGAAPHGELAALQSVWRDLPPIARAGLSNVAGPALGGAIETTLARLDLPVEHARAGARAAGVRNGYRDPLLLGVDRWLALLAAWQRVRGPCLVVHAGSALVVDALGVDALDAGGLFLGGCIAPGLGLMRGAVLEATQLPDLAQGALVTFPDNTADALHSGILLAALGAIRHMRDNLKQIAGTLPPCFLAGGDAELLASHIEPPVQLAEHLVLEGLAIQTLAIPTLKSRKT
jgi:type III pantothenate kinase